MSDNSYPTYIHSALSKPMTVQQLYQPQMEPTRFASTFQNTPEVTRSTFTVSTIIYNQKYEYETMKPQLILYLSHSQTSLHLWNGCLSTIFCTQAYISSLCYTYPMITFILLQLLTQAVSQDRKSRIQGRERLFCFQHGFVKWNHPSYLLFMLKMRLASFSLWPSMYVHMHTMLN